MLVAAMGSLGGSNHIFPRFYRHAFVVAIDSFDNSTLNLIFSSINEWHFSKGYVDKVANLAKVCKMSGLSFTFPLSTFRTFLLLGSQRSLCRNISRSDF